MLVAAVSLLVLSACTGHGERTFPDLRITTASPAVLTAGAAINVTGSGFYAVTDSVGMTIEVCGTTLSASLVEPIFRSITLPQEGIITAEVGSQLTGTVPEAGFTAGTSAVRVVRPDGNSALLADAVTCVASGTEPDPEPEPEPDPNPVPEPQPDPHPVPEPEPKPDPNPVPKPEPEPEPDPNPEPDPEPDPEPQPDPEPEPAAVQADFTASSVTGVAPVGITFDASASTGEGELSYAWDFGVAGATASGATVSYEFAQAGVYTVTLTVTDETGAVAAATMEITVNPVLQAVIRHGEVSGYAPVTVAFDATGSTGTLPLTFEWDFGVDGATATEAETEFTFTRSGTYTVTLTVTDGTGSSDSTTLSVTVGVTPAEVSFSAVPADLNADSEVIVTGDGYHGIVSLADGVLDLPPGEYTLVPEAFTRSDWLDASEVTSIWTAEPQTVSVAEGEHRSVVFSFQPTPGALSLTRMGLPDGDYPAALTTEALHTPLGLPADTSDLNQLLPGVYRLTSTSIEITSGAGAESFVTRYSPVHVTTRLVVNSGHTRHHEVHFEAETVSGLQPVITGLPADAPQPVMQLFDTDDNPVPAPWENLSPGHYRLQFSPVDYTMVAGAPRMSGAPVNALIRYVAQPALLDVYLSSNEDASHGTHYEAEAAQLEVEIIAPAGQDTADVTIYDWNGAQVQHFSQATGGPFHVTVPPGEYRVEFRDPLGYRVVQGSHTPTGTLLVDRTPSYGNTMNTFRVAVEYAPLVPVGFRFDPSGLNVSALTVRDSGNRPVATVSTGSTYVQLTPGTYSIPSGQPVATRTVQYPISVVTYPVIENYAVTGPTDFTVTAADAPVDVTVNYSLLHGGVNLFVTGLPSGAQPGYTLTRWTGESWTVVSNPSLASLPPAVYELVMHDVVITTGPDAGTYTTGGAIERFTVNGTSRTPVDVTYERR